MKTKMSTSERMPKKDDGKYSDKELKKSHKELKHAKAEAFEHEKRGMKRWKAEDMHVTNKNLQKVRTEKGK